MLLFKDEVSYFHLFYSIDIDFLDFALVPTRIQPHKLRRARKAICFAIQTILDFISDRMRIFSVAELKQKNDII